MGKGKGKAIVPDVGEVGGGNRVSSKFVGYLLTSSVSLGNVS